MKFKLKSKFKPSGDQPQAIEKLVRELKKGAKTQTLLGVTGSGKTFSIANVIEKTQKPTLVISHNKTLAAQLASEFREFFPKNAVQYFVSYYDYYQPEAYIARTDTYIEKETQINEEIDRLRYAAVQSLLSRRDVIIVASVSCIYNIGAPAAFKKNHLHLTLKTGITREKLLIRLVEMRYERNEIDFFRGRFRARGEVVEVFPAASEHTAIRFNFLGNDLEEISEIDVLTGEIINHFKEIDIYPASLYQADKDFFEKGLQQIKQDLPKEVMAMKKINKELEAQRLEQRTNYDLEMMENVGYCNGIENYSRYFDGRAVGQAPYSLMEYFPKDYLLVIDESHQTIPQIGGMYNGDRARKQELVKHGFRLSAALDNRPLKFEEFEARMGQTIFVSATPGKYEKASTNIVAEQLIRPTGIVEPQIFVRPTKNQIEDLLTEIKICIKNKQRVLVTTLTKRMAEKLAEYINEQGVKVQYLHSDIDTLERLEILRDLRLGKYDVLVGINLLREGLDLPEVALVAILDADKEGFLRSETSLVQVIGRAARNIDAKAIMYAEVVTGSMQNAMKEINRRRKTQEAYNKKHHLTPQTIIKKIREDRLGGKKTEEQQPVIFLEEIKKLDKKEKQHLLHDLQNQMKLSAENLEFEHAASLRDQINLLKKQK
ncbi:MAG: excinuclease ABC subunit B [Candidatus Kerfeldbacteria bacterium RIFOXYA2_FULL_38_24]|uniref:UvrABC system protein B n=1 Tax=Candidatus Kerfeldbacteria bacterium RIFOXYB2_FULL_38_14 TaxID=1798547 RepID=A0A1G2BFN0_9BACT|nr:MAG: excinuclease ABC subunit B [Candidatus Kerfeldbacteria bacterium RIFOXYB2_FULL_38_14]OGY88194.1 MAG: excinuclease ABC subunit B [Candidatus Kerfeldbacteria bacterium RIFOXYA2_FULL_38_24]OGY89214.1 MAG: excinuclease ABC subunit B [Candidatus Kerfeldbacteria bacterium RIFOXYC2_FULL_38_9]